MLAQVRAAGIAPSRERDGAAGALMKVAAPQGASKRPRPDCQVKSRFGRDTASASKLDHLANCRAFAQPVEAEIDVGKSQSTGQ